MSAEQPIAMAITALTAAARQTRTRGAGTEQATTEPVDFAEIACHVLTAVAANAGGVESLLAGRPGSWEADLVRKIVHRTAGDHLDRYRTVPVRLGVDVAGAFDDFGIDEMAAREEDAAVEATFDDSLTEAGQARADALADAIARLRREDEDAYLAAYRQIVVGRAAELGITVPVEVTRNGDYEGDTGDDETVAGLHAHAREHTPLPMTGQPPAGSAEAITEIIRLLGRTYTARAQAAIDVETATAASDGLAIITAAAPDDEPDLPRPADTKGDGWPYSQNLLLSFLACQACGSCSRADNGGGYPCDCPVPCGARYCQHAAADKIAGTEQYVPPEHRADPDEDARVARLTRRWVQAIDAALASAGEAQGILRELERHDIELCEGAEGATAKAALAGAWGQLYAVGDIARGRLKLIEYAELVAEVKGLRTRNAEVERLRAEVDQLQGRLTDHGCSDSNCDVCSDGASAQAVVAEDATRYHGLIRVTAGGFRFCALAPGHQGDCGDSCGHLIIPVADAPDPIAGEGADRA